MAKIIDPQTKFQLDVLNQFAFLSSPAGVDPLEKFKHLVDSRLDNLLSCDSTGISDESFPFDLDYSYDDDSQEDLTADQWAQVFAEANKVTASALLNGSRRNIVARSSSVTPAILPAEDLDQTVSFDCNVSSSIIRPDADSTTRSSLALNQETARALDILQRRRSGTLSKLPIPSPSNRPPFIKSSRGFFLPDIDATLKPASSSERSLPQMGFHSKQPLPFKSPLPPSKVPSPDESSKRATHTPRKMATFIGDSSAKPNRVSTRYKGSRLNGAESEPDVLGAVGGVENKSREEATLDSFSTPQRGSRSLSKDSSASSSRFSSPFSSPLFNSKKGKSPSPVLTRLKRPLMGEIASKAASLKAAVENKLAGDKRKRRNEITDQEKKNGNIEILPSVKKASQMPATKRESTFTREIPAKAPASKPAAEPRRRRRSLNSGNQTSK